MARGHGREFWIVHHRYGFKAWDVCSKDWKYYDHDAMPIPKPDPNAIENEPLASRSVSNYELKKLGFYQ